MGLIVESGISRECFVDIGKVAAHAWTEVGQRTAGIDEGHENDLASEFIEVKRVVALVSEVDVGNLIAALWRVVLDRRLIVGPRLADDDDIIEFRVVEALRILLHQNLRGDAITRVKFPNHARVFEFIGHDHGFHKAWDVVSVERDMSGICADDLPSDTEGLPRRTECIPGLSRRLPTPGEERGKEKKKRRRPGGQDAIAEQGASS